MLRWRDEAYFSMQFIQLHEKLQKMSLSSLVYIIKVTLTSFCIKVGNQCFKSAEIKASSE